MKPVFLAAFCSLAFLSGCTTSYFDKPSSVLNSDRSAMAVADCVYSAWENGAEAGNYSVEDIGYSTTSIGFVITKPADRDLPTGWATAPRLDYYLQVEALLDDRSQTVLKARDFVTDLEETIAMVTGCHK